MSVVEKGDDNNRVYHPSAGQMPELGGVTVIIVIPLRLGVSLEGTVG